MKRTTKLMAILLAVLTVASSISIAAYNKLGEPFDGYDDYGYYAYFDFEIAEQVVKGQNKTLLHQGASINALGKNCNPFRIVNYNGGITNAWATYVKGEDNSYLNVKQNGTDDYSAVAVFHDKIGYTVNDSLEISVKFRINETAQSDDRQQPIINLRRGKSDNNSNSAAYVFADEAGRIFVRVSTNIDGESTSRQVYTLSNEEKGKFVDLKLIWFDTTNTYNVYVNGRTVAEGIKLAAELRADAFVKKTYNDDFGLESLKLAATTEFRAIEIFRRASSAHAFDYDVDDIIIRRYEGEQRGSYYYENSFEGAYEGLTSTPNKDGTYTTSVPYYYGFSSGTKANTTNLVVKTETVGGVTNKYLSIDNDSIIGFQDGEYQMFTQGSYVFEYSIRGKLKEGISDKKSLVAIADHNAVDYYFLPVDSEGNLYLTGADNTKIQGYRLDENEWLNVTMVFIKNETNKGKFGTLNNLDPSKTNKSKNNQTYSVAFYLNGQYVGTSDVAEYFEWTAEKNRTAHNYDYILTEHTVNEDQSNALDISGLGLVLVDSTTTQNHEIYRTSDKLTYYDVTFDGDKQTAYSEMVLTDKRDRREDSFKFFNGANFKGDIDNVRIYEGTAPEWVYENLNTHGTLVDVKFGVLSSCNSGSNTVLTNEKDPDATGVVFSNNFKPSRIVKAKDSSYATLKLQPADWVDYLVPPVDMSADKVDETISFETKVKNFDFSIKNAAKSVGFFSQRFQYSTSKYASSSKLINVNSDYQLYAGNDHPVFFYTSDREKATIDNAEWSKLRVDMHVSKDGDAKSVAFSFYLNDELLFLEDGSLASHIDIADASACAYYGINNHRIRFVQMSKADTNGAVDEYINFDAEYLKISKLSDGAKLVGLQKNALNGSVRFIAGIDALHFSKVGFEVEIFEGGVSKGVQTVQTASVFEQISAGDTPLTAEEVDYNYLAAVKIVDLPENIPANSYILVRSFATVKGEDGAEDEKIYDDWFKVVVSDDGYYFDTDFVS